MLTTAKTDLDVESPTSVDSGLPCGVQEGSDSDGLDTKVVLVKRACVVWGLANFSEDKFECMRDGLSWLFDACYAMVLCISGTVLMVP